MAGKGNNGANKGKLYNTYSNRKNNALKEPTKAPETKEDSTPAPESKSTFDQSKIDAIVAADKKRADLKDPATEAKKKEVDVIYEDLRTDEEKEADAKSEEKKEKQAAAEEAAETEQVWDGFNGEMIIFALEEFSPKIANKLCERMNRQKPDPAKLLYSETQKKIMRPGADQVMKRFILMMKDPLYAFVGVAVIHLFTSVMMQPKIDDPKFKIEEPEPITE